LLNGYPWAELPNENAYWSYPINANNREWYQISGDWMGSSANNPTQLRWQPYGTAPNSGHIVWKQPIKIGGMIGGDYGSISYVASTQAVVVMDGKVFTNIPLPVISTAAFGSSVNQFRCIDQTTGQVLYVANGSISGGIHLPGSEYAQTNVATQEGGIVVLPSSYGSYQYSYLYGTATVAGITYWNYYDPMTGTLVRQISNCSSARLIDGTVLAFGAANSPTILGGSYVYRWNLTSVVNNNWSTGITWKTPMPKPNAYLTPSIFAVSQDASVIVVGSRNQYWGYNADTGAQLWNLTLDYPVTTNEEMALANVDMFIVFDAVHSTFHCYSILTGAQLFETASFADSPWATTYTIYTSETNDLNNLYCAFPDGSVRAFSLTDGHLVWTSTAIPSTEYANNVIPLIQGGFVLVDGKIYVYGGYAISYQIDPVPRFACLLCINATTGDTLFTLNGGVAPSAAANGYLIGASTFDGNLYCLGKGKTSTSITIQNNAIVQGATVLIQGNVLDQSPAQPGTPAVSDASISEQMDYLHMQNSTLLNSPPTPTGVQVTLTAVDSNNNPITVGTTTTDAAGNFYYSYVPSQTGIYKITATFAGSNSYYSSSSETGVTVTEAPLPTATTTSNAATTTDVSSILTYLVVGIVAIIIAIAIVGVLLLRKK